ncbi:MAG: hypothetical protein J6Y93_02545 [Treponema sp.]|nr:hypothetical protein [Treponema sp.]
MEAFFFNHTLAFAGIAFVLVLLAGAVINFGIVVGLNWILNKLEEKQKEIRPENDCI